MSHEARQLHQQWAQLIVQDGVLYRKVENQDHFHAARGGTNISWLHQITLQDGWKLMQSQIKRQ